MMTKGILLVSTTQTMILWRHGFLWQNRVGGTLTMDDIFDVADRHGLQVFEIRSSDSLVLTSKNGEIFVCSDPVISIHGETSCYSLQFNLG